MVERERERERKYLIFYGLVLVYCEKQRRVEEEERKS
jgi:hypothetical protein